MIRPSSFSIYRSPVASRSYASLLLSVFIASFSRAASKKKKRERNRETEKEKERNSRSDSMIDNWEAEKWAKWRYIFSLSLFQLDLAIEHVSLIVAGYLAGIGSTTVRARDSSRLPSLFSSFASRREILSLCRTASHSTIAVIEYTWLPLFVVPFPSISPFSLCHERFNEASLC